MKYSCLKFSFWILLLTVNSNTVLAQATNGVASNNQFNSAYYIGWNGSNGINPLFFKTNAINRMRLNGTQTTTIAGYGGNNVSGYFGIGSGGVPTLDTWFATNSPMSLLQLKGRIGTFVQTNGYRPWMQTGISFTDNQDFSYMGLRQVGTSNDVTETAIVWADNAGLASPVGPDDFTFRFTTAGSGAPVINQNDLFVSNDLDGLHIARYTGDGLMALGNTFGVNPTGTPINLYVRPQSLLHMSYVHRGGGVNEPYGFMQITYRRPLAQSVDIIGQGEAVTDGLRFGIDNDIIYPSTTYQHLNGYLRWQEASSFIIQTEDDATPSIAQSERMRITSVGALKLTQGLNYGGIITPNNVTRIGISREGSTPTVLSQPMSLLHLGYNMGMSISQDTNSVFSNGWRYWMDLGMLASNKTDHVWIGLKPENGVAVQSTNRMDAVIAWGDNGDSIPSNFGTDVMRFIFTADTGSTVDSPTSKTMDGLEVMRLYPDADTTFSYLEPYDSLNQNYDSLRLYGRVGIGDFTATGVNQQPTHKLDVIGNGRFRYLPDSLYLADSLVNKYVMVDSAGVLRWTTSARFGTTCGDTVGGIFNENRKVDLNNYNFYFTKNDSLGVNHVGVGYECGDSLPAKLSVLQIHPASVNQSTIAVYGLNSDTTNTQNNVYTGVLGTANGLHPIDMRTTNRGGAFFAVGGDVNYGVYAESKKDSLENYQNIGGSLTGTDGVVAIGVFATGRSGELRTVGVSGTATSPNYVGNPPSTLENIGGQFNGGFSDGTNYGIKTVGYGGAQAYGIWATAIGATNNTAGYFDGLIETTQTYSIVSDEQFKTDVTNSANALGIVVKLRPRDYYMDTVNFEQFNFSKVKQHGFIAQEVETLLPELVINSVHPGVYDSLGNELISPLPYKSLNYNGFIPLHTQAIKELNAKVDKNSLSDQTIKTNVQDLSGSLDKVLEMRGVTYDWNTTVHPELNLDSNTHVGFIAQEIEAIDPLLTFVDEDTLMHVRYEKVVPILAESIEELNDIIESKDSIIEAQGNAIDDLNARLTNLENCLSNLLPILCQANQTAIQQTPDETQEQLERAINVTLSNRNNIVLNQNVPNPFAESTVITYSIPSTVQKAQIHFYDGNGKLINSVDIVERGQGQLNVFANDLSTGVYTYSLVADGQIVSTIRMMKQ